MSRNPCPQCGAEIAVEKINIAQGVGLCDACGALSQLSQIVDQQAWHPEALREIPLGCSIQEWGNETVIRASLRSPGNMVGVTFACLFWNGITSFFVVFAISATVANFGWQAPSWMPAPIMNGSRVSPGMNVFLWVFLLPFMIIGAVLMMSMVLSFAGQVIVVIQGEKGIVRTGAGPLAWTKSFDALAVESVTIDLTRGQQNSQSRQLIQIEADRKVRFGTMIPDARRFWMCAMLHKLLVQDRR